MVVAAEEAAAAATVMEVEEVTTITEEVVPIPEVAVVATEVAVAVIATKQSPTRASLICVLSCLCSDLRTYTYRSSRYLFVETRQ